MTENALHERIADLERRVRAIESPHPNIGRRCRHRGQPQWNALTVVHVEWDGTLLVRAPDWCPDWVPLRVAESDVEWLDEARPLPAAQVADVRISNTFDPSAVLAWLDTPEAIERILAALRRPRHPQPREFDPLSVTRADDGSLVAPFPRSDDVRHPHPLSED